jgi:hydrogenase maturation protease
MSRILILGLGNPLMADDGVGHAVIERIRRAVPPTTARAEWAPDVLSLPGLWRAEGEVWLVDAMIRGAAPGSVHRLDHADLMALEQRHESAHHLSLPESLRWIALAFPKMASIHYRLWGVEPREVVARRGLGAAVRAAAERVASEILADLASLTAAGCD